MLPELPRHHIQRKSVWNDSKGRTLVCIDIWDTPDGKYEIELLVLGGKKPLEFVKRPWPEIFQLIQDGNMQRANV
jgi:hypothetical protein